MSDLIWAGALVIPLMTLVLGLLGPARRALTRLSDAYGKSAAEREARAALDLADAEQDRHELAVRKGSLAEEVAREKAKLALETAQYETDAAAARQCLPAAVAARRRALEARADAEAALAPEAVRKALEPGTEWLAGAYTEYLAKMTYHATSILPFGEWVQGFEGVPRV